MKKLEEIILSRGQVLDGNILKVDSFLNQQIDIKLMKEMGKEFADHFREKNITKILTVESSGIAPAMATGEALGCDVIFARKQKSLTTDDYSYSSTAYSYTKEEMKQLIISKEFIDENDNILLIDDFLANGQAIKAMLAICKQAGANVAGVGIVIEKSFQDGRKLLDDMGVDVLSLARISVLSTENIEFLD
ncbi:MAG: xanthine phosphoribosyltransferase [Anaerococcus sp.]